MIKCVPINLQSLEETQVEYTSHQTASAKYTLYSSIQGFTHLGHVQLHVGTHVHLHVGHHVGHRNVVLALCEVSETLPVFDLTIFESEWLC